MGQSTEELTDDIQATRQNLSRDIDELTDKVSPSRVVHRRKEAAKGRLMSLRDRVMGTAHSATDSVSSSASGAADSISGTAQSAGGTIADKTEGNPLAAGLVAFGAGMVISSLIPASRKETELAQQAVDAAKEHGQPVIDQAKSVAGEVGENLKESADQSVQDVKATAQEATERVKGEGQASAQSVRDQATPRS